MTEKYRNLTYAQFESERREEYLGKQSDMARLAVSKTLISQPGMYRVETTGSGEKTIVISNGKFVWTFFPDSNEYEALPAGQGNFTQSPVGAYVLLDQLREPARILGKERVLNTDCMVLTLGSDPDHTRTISVDPGTDFIRKDETKNSQALGLRGNPRQCSRSASSSFGLSITSRSLRPLPPWT